jgi:hypothetical protein
MPLIIHVLSTAAVLDANTWCVIFTGDLAAQTGATLKVTYASPAVYGSFVVQKGRPVRC